MYTHRAHLRNHQRGAALIVALTILIVMTLIGVTSMRTTTLEEKMAGNLQDRNRAFQAAETALRDAEENFIEGLANTTGFDGTGGLYGEDDAEPGDIFASSVWTSGNSREYSGSLSDLAADPRYIVKIISSVDAQQPKKLNIRSYGEQPPGGNATIFRITARGVGGSAKSQVILRSHYGKVF